MRSSFIAIAFLVCCAVATAEMTFLDPVFDRLEPSELTKLLEATKKDDEPSNLQRAMLLFFLAERSNLERRPHEANRLLRSVEETCDEFSVSSFTVLPRDMRSRAAYLCVMVRSELLDLNAPWFSGARASKLIEELASAQLGEMGQVERWYVEGRIFYQLPPSLGQNIKTSLVALSFLERARTDLSSVIYFLGRAHLARGNREKAEEYFEKGLKQKTPDTRSSLQLQEPFFESMPFELDGRRFGISPTIYYNPWQGFVAGLSVGDDRLFDTRRTIRISGAFGTREYWNAKFQYFDGSLLPGGIGFGVKATTGRTTEDFFGLGIETAETDPGRIKLSRLSAEAYLEQNIVDKFYLRLGWRSQESKFFAAEGNKTFTGLPHLQQASYGGPIGELGYDGRDSRVDPREGTYVSLQGFFPNKSMGSPIEFKRWKGEWEQAIMVGGSHVALFRAGVVGLEGDVPFAEYPTLGASVALPGVRAARIQARNVAGFSMEYRGRLSEGLRVALFTMGGTAAPSFPELWKEKVKFGLGAGLQWQPGKYRAPLYRLEIGRFASDTVIQVAGELAL